MATLTIDDQTARRIYPSADPELKAVLDSSYPKNFFSLKITDRIKSFEDACEFNNTNPLAKRFTRGTRNQIYQERVAEIVKALNEGWVPNYDDSSEYKWGPYFYLNSPGFRFGGSDCGISGTDTSGGSRFALKNQALSNYAGTQFVKEYEKWLTPVAEETKSKIMGCYSTSPKPYTGSTMEEWENYIIPLVPSFEAACSLTGEDPADDKFSEGEPDEIAYKRGKVIVRALNGSWVLNWKDKSQRKWHAWLEHDGSGFRFYDSGYGVSAANATGGSRLRLCSEKIAMYFATQFPGEMMDFWL